jgi:di/tricarboxylate transporter
MAMAVGARAGVPPFLMTIMVGHGALAGALSPFAPTGVIARDRMRDIGLVGYEWPIFFHNLLANTTVAFGGFALFSGWRLFGRRHVEPRLEDCTSLQPRHYLTLAIISVLILAVLCLKVDIGLAAFAAAALLALLRLADDQEALRKMPWGVLVMVSGVTVLTALLGRTGGTQRFADLIGTVAGPRSAVFVMAVVVGFVSVYASTSGVVLPAFLPMVPGLIVACGGGDALGFATTIIVSGHLVDCSPLSTIGALCVASAPATTDRRLLFNAVLAWGLSMVLVGAVLCFVCFAWW